MTALIQPALLPSDLDGIVDIHMITFPGFFLTSMGRGFVREYYRCVLEYPHRIGFVARHQERTIGFAIGFAVPQDFYAFYRARRGKLIPWIMVAAIRRPLLIPRIIRNVKRVSAVESQDGDVELSSISVLPEHSGKGIARMLITCFIETAQTKGYRSIYLSTDADGNERVNAFYRKQGFQIEHKLLQGQRKMNLFRLFLTKMADE